MDPIRSGIAYNLQTSSVNPADAAQAAARVQPSGHASSLTLAILIRHAFNALHAKEMHWRHAPSPSVTSSLPMIGSCTRRLRQWFPDEHLGRTLRSANGILTTDRSARLTHLSIPEWRRYVGWSSDRFDGCFSTPHKSHDVHCLLSLTTSCCCERLVFRGAVRAQVPGCVSFFAGLFPIFFLSGLFRFLEGLAPGSGLLGVKAFVAAILTQVDLGKIGGFKDDS